MKTKLFYLFTVLLLAFTSLVNAQIKVTEEDPASAKPTAHGVIVHADPRLAILVKKYRNVQLGVIRSGRGYRVQIYSGADRSKALERKVDFMRRFPGVKTYLTYAQPQYRVKVGDFRSRGEAQKMYEQVNTLYNPCMIVPDIIVINTLKDD